MCGVVGYLGGDFEGGREGAQALVTRMGQALLHRGPDSGGYWIDTRARVALGHRRLAILDLTSAGHQPMVSPSGRYVLTFNGEIYNHQDLRLELEREGRAGEWLGHSDSETLVNGFDAWGIERTTRAAAGMFAFAVWDRHTQRLTLVRDRLGEKPLYYGWQCRGGMRTFLFASELKALRCHPAFEGTIDRHALARYMGRGNVPGGLSIFEGLAKVPPGCIVAVSQDRPSPEVTCYWSIGDVASSAARAARPSDERGVVDELEARLSKAVKRQMMADVPLGAFLSGGVDSSTVAALMQTQSSRPVRTYSIGFGEDAYNEADHAKRVARHLGTDHTELFLRPADALAVVPELPRIYDEPFADSSQIPSILLARLARRDVTVALSGDGGDETFCGYTRHQFVAEAWPWMKRMPRFTRNLAGRAIKTRSPAAWDRMAASIESMLPALGRWSHLGDKLHKLATAMESASVVELHQRLISLWDDPCGVVLRGDAPGAAVVTTPPPGLGDLGTMQVLDMQSYLPDDILTKVDRAAMAASLETRIPMLDHQLIEFSLGMPLSCKLRREGPRWVTKWALRQVLHRHVPRELIERPKMGFAVPLDSWLRGPLRDWAEALLDEARLRREGYLHPRPIRERWAEHLSGRRNWQHHIWCVLMFQAWMEQHN